MGWPSAPRIRLVLPKPIVITKAAAFSTPSTAATVSTRPGSSRARWSPSKGSLKSTSPWTWVSISSLPLAKRSSKTLSSVSVSTNVPDMKATPRTIATIVEIIRRL